MRNISASARPASNTAAVIAPGPAIKGMASGNAAMLRTCSSSACSAERDWRWVRKPNTISEAIENSKRPPAMRKAGSEIESVTSSQPPIRAAPTRIAAAIRLARSATLRRDLAARSCVTPMNAGTNPIGSTTTSSVTNAEMRNSLCIQTAKRAR